MSQEAEAVRTVTTGLFSD